VLIGLGEGCSKGSGFRARVAIGRAMHSMCLIRLSLAVIVGVHFTAIRNASTEMSYS